MGFNSAFKGLKVHSVWYFCNWRTGISVISIRFKASSQNCEKRLLVSSRLSVSLCVRMEQSGYHWADFHEI